MTIYTINIVATVDVDTQEEAERAMLAMLPWTALDEAGVDLRQATVESEEP